MRHPSRQQFTGSFVYRSRLSLVCLTAAFAASTVAASSPDFERDVRPLLERSCFACHGPEKQKSGYRLDIRDIALRGGDSGEPAILPHNAKKSPLIRYVSGEDEDMQMPPKKSDKPRLSAAEVQILRDWIDAGPAWPDNLAGKSDAKPHWSLTTLTKPAVPAASENPIDAFIVAKLAEKNLHPSPEADPRTLIRRITYDLTGLPPTADDVDAFVASCNTGPLDLQYRGLVDKLLASPHYGEHWARHWLDVANFADTHGNDHDFARWNAWPYRDYVIRAFNDDKPYARFVQEQVAGDVLFPEDPQATVALGFVAAGPWDHTLMVTVREDTVDHRMSQNLDRDNMVTTVIGTFQSLTIHCARCHNHKFDPITQREYYSLQAVFAGVDRADRPYDVDARTQVERTRLLAEKRVLEKPDDTLLDSPEVTGKVRTWTETLLQREKAWAPFDVLSVVSTGGATLTRQPDGSWLASGARPAKDSYIITARRHAGKLGAVRLEVLPDERLPQRGPGRWDNGNFHLSEFRAFAGKAGAGESAKPLTIARAVADYDEGPSISAAQAIDGKDETHWGVHPRYGEPHEAVFELKEVADFPEETTFTLVLEFQAAAQGHDIGRFRLSASGDTSSAIVTPVSTELAKMLRAPEQNRTPAQRRELALTVLKTENQRALAALPAPSFVYAITRDFPPDGQNFKPSQQPRPIHLLARGELSKPGDLIGPGTLGCVPGMSSELKISDAGDEAQRRAALARWLASDQNALTWRSIVNRVWAYHFGRGLCDTPNDFGKMGGTPSNPELLDWLAVWFRDEAKGSIKQLHRIIMTSATYRQTSLGFRSAPVASPDSDNRLLARQNRVRLAAEQVRDTLLACSGKLDTTMGGPSAVQFISRGDATFNAGGNPPFLDYEHFDQDSPAALRRSIYRFVFRTVPDPLMDALDCPDGGTFTPVRSQSTTAIQAFALLNNPYVIRQCEHIAARVKKEAKDGEEIVSLFRLMLQRMPGTNEASHFAAYAKRHSLANAVQIIVNSNEFLHLD